MASWSSTMLRRSSSFPERSMEKYPGFSVGIKTRLGGRVRLADSRIDRRVLTRQLPFRPKSGSTRGRILSEGIRITIAAALPLFQDPALRLGR